MISASKASSVLFAYVLYCSSEKKEARRYKFRALMPFVLGSAPSEESLRVGNRRSDWDGEVE